MKQLQHLFRSLLLSTLVAFTLPAASLAQTATKTTALGTHTVWGTVNGIAIEGMVQGPSAQITPLQVACVFEYTEGDIYNAPALPAALNGMVHLDEALKGLITDIRKSGKFEGHAYETLLITPPAGTLGGRQLLLIGLGNRNTFNAELMVGIGAIATREALRLGVDSYSFASDIKDAGIDSPTALVAENVTKGAIEAYRTDLWLKDKGMSSSKPLNKITLLAGPAFFEVAGQGIQQAITNLK
ncbi:peptidase M17 [Flavobacterium akiainvivens]|uniref:Peptidase M17 n=1 Tax=Flavobacterium akiainvivens TaxID=1202724 RepID=A0A0M8MBZ3_9FLAO|nr:M17 family peptidase N-terminal domain-containing protein [Flavobacterium akiainvivens]KOS05564.1 peptidase M17 [Flavobacterium akiainvivens]SFQ34366.1 Cytosol aminopeptidase family, N-terminal domain [Flavobacterium akiainvivens]